jgi:hypothetical protein
MINARLLRRLCQRCRHTIAVAAAATTSNTAPTHTTAMTHGRVAGGFPPSASTSVDCATVVLPAGTVVINVCGTPRVVVGSAAVFVAGGTRVVAGLVVANNVVVGTAGLFVVVKVEGGAVVVVMPRGVVDVTAVGGGGAVDTPPGEAGAVVALGGTVVRGRSGTVRVRCVRSMTRVRDALPVTVLIFVRVPAGE